MITFEKIKTPFGPVVQTKGFVIHVRSLPPKDQPFDTVATRLIKSADDLKFIELEIPGFDLGSSDAIHADIQKVCFFTKQKDKDYCLYSADLSSLYFPFDSKRVILIPVQRHAEQCVRASSPRILSDDSIFWLGAFLEGKSLSFSLNVSKNLQTQSLPLPPHVQQPYQVALSPQKSSLALSTYDKKEPIFYRNRLHIFDLNNDKGQYSLSERKPPKPSHHDMSFHCPLWLSNEEICYISTSHGWHGIFCYNIQKQNTEPLYQEPELSVATIYGNHSSKALSYQSKVNQIIFTIRKNGIDKISLLEPKQHRETGKSSDELPAANSVIHSVNCSLTSFTQVMLTESQKIVCVGSSIDFLPGIYCIDVEPNKTTTEPIQIQSELSKVFLNTNLDLQCLHPSMPCPGLLYQPREYNEGANALVILIHGGPHLDVSACWPVKAKFLGQFGFSTLYLNYPGSSGHGTKHRDLLWGRWFEYERDCIIETIKKIKEDSLFKAERIFLWGGDLGASLILQIINKKPRLVNGAICVYPILDLLDFYDKQPLGKQNYFRKLTPCEHQSNQELRTWLKRNSPIHACQQIEDKIILFHGEKDKLVDQQHYELFIQSLRSQGRNFTSHSFENEGHNWQLPSTYESYYRLVKEFLLDDS